MVDVSSLDISLVLRLKYVEIFIHLEIQDPKNP